MKLMKILTLNLMITLVMCILIFPVHGADTTTKLHVIKYTCDGTTILNEIWINHTEMAADLPVIGDGITHYYHQGPIFDSPPGPWDESESTNFKDKGALKGTDVKDLCEMVGGMSPGDEIEIRAVDGLTRRFGYTNVYEPQSSQGPMVLCWYKDGNHIPDYEDGMQMVFFADNSTNPGQKHVFGNWDMHECLAPEYRYNYSGVYPSTDGLSVKWVDKIAIYSDEQAQDFWKLALSGEITDDMYSLTFESCVECHSVSWTDKNSQEWSGVPLWLLAGIVDDTNIHGSGAFNDKLAEQGYDVTVTAGDGYSKIFNSVDLARNESYIVACYLNGSELPEFTDEGKPLAPLKLVGPFLSSGQKVSNIANISLDISTATPEIDFTIIGDESKCYTLDMIKAMPSYAAGGGFKKSTGVIEGPHMYTGINITYLIDIVGGITPSNSLKVTASDGYSMLYSYDQVMGDLTTYNITTGEPEPEPDGPVTMVLAYEENGDPISDAYGGPLRIAFTGSGSQITEGHFWIKYVKEIEVLGAVDEWNVTLDGAITDIIDRSTFESCSGCHARKWTDDNNQQWSGVPLWLLAGVVDDNVSSEAKHYFNDSLANEGYNVTVIAGDGYSKTFNSTFIKRNDNIILANEISGSILPEEYYPLRLTGPALKKNEMVGNVIEMRIPELISNSDAGTQ